MEVDGVGEHSRALLTPSKSMTTRNLRSARDGAFDRKLAIQRKQRKRVTPWRQSLAATLGMSYLLPVGTLLGSGRGSPKRPPHTLLCARRAPSWSDAWLPKRAPRV